MKPPDPAVLPKLQKMKARIEIICDFEELEKRHGGVDRLPLNFRALPQTVIRGQHGSECVADLCQRRG
jgi:hypothetical protein